MNINITNNFRTSEKSDSSAFYDKKKSLYIINSIVVSNKTIKDIIN